MAASAGSALHVRSRATARLVPASRRHRLQAA
jgi:hypothetical protein